MPPEVRAALLLWLTALVVLEAGLGPVTHGGDGLRLLAFVGAMVLVTRMAAGRAWARTALTVVALLGSAPWLAVAALSWLGGDPALGLAPDRLLGGAPDGPTAVLLAASVIAHVSAAVAAVVYMFRPAANRYFREHARRRPAPEHTTRVHLVGRGGAAAARGGQPAAELR